MLCRGIIALSSEIRIKHINALCGHNEEFFSAEPNVTTGLERVKTWPLSPLRGEVWVTDTVSLFLDFIHR